MANPFLFKTSLEEEEEKKVARANPFLFKTTEEQIQEVQIEEPVKKESFFKRTARALLPKAFGIEEKVLGKKPEEKKIEQPAQTIVSEEDRNIWGSEINYDAVQLSAQRKLLETQAEFKRVQLEPDSPQKVQKITELSHTISGYADFLSQPKNSPVLNPLLAEAQKRQETISKAEPQSYWGKFLTFAVNTFTPEPEPYIRPDIREKAVSDLAEQIKKEQDPNIIIATDNFIPTNFIKAGSGATLLNEAEQRVAAEYQQQHPIISAIPAIIGFTANFLLPAGKVFAIPKLAGLESLFPRTAAILAKSLQGAKTFGTIDLVQEMLNEAKQRQRDLKKIVTAGAKGVAFGAFFGLLAPITSYPLRVVAGGGVLGGWATLEGYLQDRKLDANDIHNIVLNTLIGMAFEGLLGKSAIEQYKGEMRERLGENITIARIMDRAGVSRKEAEKVALVLEKLPGNFGEEFKTRIVNQLKEVPESFKNLNFNTKTAYYNKIVKEVSKDVSIPEAVQKANSAFNLVSPQPIPGKAEVAAGVLEKKLVGQERLRKSAKGAQLLQEQLAASEKAGKDIAFQKQVDVMWEAMFKQEVKKAKEKKVAPIAEQAAKPSEIAPEAPKIAPEIQKGVAGEFKVGDVIDTQGKSNMVGKATIREITGNIIKFTDSKGTDFAGMRRADLRKLVNAGEWKKISLETPTIPPELEPLAQEARKYGSVENFVEDAVHLKRFDYLVDKSRTADLERINQLKNNVSKAERWLTQRSDYSRLTPHDRINTPEGIDLMAAREQLDAVFRSEKRKQLTDFYNQAVGKVGKEKPEKKLTKAEEHIKAVEAHNKRVATIPKEERFLPEEEKKPSKLPKSTQMLLDNAIQGIKDDVAEDPDRSVAAIVHGRGFTFNDDIQQLIDYAISIDDADFINLLLADFKEYIPEEFRETPEEAFGKLGYTSEQVKTLEKIAELAPDEAFTADTDEEYEAGFEAEGEGKVNFDDTKQVFHSTETVARVPDPETLARISALKQPLNQLGYVVNLIRAGKVVPEDLRWLVDQYNEDAARQVGEYVVEDLGDGKYNFIFNEDVITEEGLDEFYPPEIYKEISDYKKLQEGWGIDTGDFAENDVVHFNDNGQDRWARLIDIYDNGRAVVETATGKAEIDFWSLKKPAKLTKEQEKIKEGIFPAEKITQKFSLSPQFMKAKGIETPVEQPRVPKAKREAPARNINSKIFEIVGITSDKRKNPTLPILGLVAIDGNKFISTDLETSLVYESEKNIGKIALPISALKGKSPEEIIITDPKNYKAKVGNLTFQGIGIDDLPIVPDVKGEPQFRVLDEQLRDGFKKVLTAASDSDTRIEINSVYLKSEKGQITLVATDSFRLYQYRIPGKINKDFEFIMPKRSVEQLSKILNQVKPGKVDFTIDNKTNQFKVEFGKFTFVSRLVEGKYPNYKAIIPKEAKTQITIDREELLDILSQVPKTRLNSVDIKIDRKNNQLILSAKEEGISFEEKMPIRISEKAIPVNPEADFYLLMPIKGDTTTKDVFTFNVSYFKDYLKSTDASEIDWLSNTEDRPLVFRESESVSMVNAPKFELKDTSKNFIEDYKKNTLSQLMRKPEFRYSNPKLQLRKTGRFYLNNSKIESANDVADIFSELKREAKEKAYFLHLDENNEIINITLNAIGTEDKTLVDFSGALKSARLAKAKKVYFVHNHPSGDTTASKNDHITFPNIIKMMKTSGIEVVGGVIINHTEYGFMNVNGKSEIVNYRPRLRPGQEISVTELEQILNEDVSFVDSRQPLIKGDIAKFFSEVSDSRYPVLMMISINGKGMIKGADILGHSLKNLESIKKKINKSIDVYNPSLTVLATNIDILGNLVNDDRLNLIKNYFSEINTRLVSSVQVYKDGTYKDTSINNFAEEFDNIINDNVASFAEFSEEEQAVIVAIQTGKDIPLELADAVKSLQEKGVIQAGKAEKAPREPKPVKERAPVRDLRPGERISERGITLSKSSIVKVRPYMVSYMTGQKRVVKTFETIDEARRRYDMMVEIRKGGAMRRGELPAELQPSDAQKAKAHQIANQKNITPRQYQRIAQVYTGVNSMRKMTPEQADTFISTLEALKPKFGGNISIPRTKAVVQATEAEKTFKSASLLDIFRSPANAFRRVGLGEAAAPVFSGFKLFRDFVNINYSKISKWQRELGVKTKFIFFNKKAVADQSKRLFRAINNGETEGLSEKEGLIVERARNLADEIADLVDDARREVGLEPMNRRENYITNLLTEESRQLLEKSKQAPNELFALLSEKLPASIFDRLLLQRKGGLPIKEDFWAALKAMVRVHGKYINLYPPVHTFERFMRFYGDKIPVLTRIYVRGRINRFLGRPGRIDQYLRNVDKNITAFLQKIPGLSKEVEIEFQNGMTEIIEVPRIVSKFGQGALRMLKAIRYTYDLAFSVSFYTINLTQFWINTVPKLRGNVSEVYRSAFKGYGLMLMDFFRPSRWEYWREKGVLTEVDQIIDNEFTAGFGGNILNLFAKLSEFNNRVASDLATSENMRLLEKHGKFTLLYRELATRYGKEAEDFARNLSDVTQFRYGLEEKPAFFDNPVADLWYQYNTFVIKQAEFVGQLMRNQGTMKLWKDYKKANEAGKSKEYFAELTQGQRGELFRFILNAFILSFVIGTTYMWEAVFKSIVPNQIEGGWEVLQGLWNGDGDQMGAGFKKMLVPPSGQLIENLSKYGIKATVLNAKMFKQVNLLRAIVTGETQLENIEGKKTEKISRETAVKRLFAGSREKVSQTNQKGWGIYNDLNRSYDQTRRKAQSLISDGNKDEARKLAREYNAKAKEKIKELKSLNVTDVRLKEEIKKISKSKIVSNEDFARWKKESK